VPLFASIRAIRDPFSFVCLVFFVVKKFWLPACGRQAALPR